MISKGFYQSKREKPAHEDNIKGEQSIEEVKVIPENGEDAQLGQKPPIWLDEDTGQLELTDFDIASKPPSVRKLLETYIDATELIEEL